MTTLATRLYTDNDGNRKFYLIAQLRPDDVYEIQGIEYSPEDNVPSWPFNLYRGKSRAEARRIWSRNHSEMVSGGRKWND